MVARKVLYNVCLGFTTYSLKMNHVSPDKTEDNFVWQGFSQGGDQMFLFKVMKTRIV